jgi:hypothetical protein
MSAKLFRPFEDIRDVAQWIMGNVSVFPVLHLLSLWIIYLIIKNPRPAIRFIKLGCCFFEYCRFLVVVFITKLVRIIWGSQYREEINRICRVLGL